MMITNRSINDIPVEKIINPDQVREALRSARMELITLERNGGDTSKVQERVNALVKRDTEIAMRVLGLAN